MLARRRNMVQAFNVWFGIKKFATDENKYFEIRFLVRGYGRMSFA